SYPITVRVSDAGSPPLSATQTFHVLVAGRPTIQVISGASGGVTLRWTAVAGQRYRVQFKNQLNAPLWQELAVLTAASVTASIDISPGTAAGQRFYRLVLD